jgi:hypothetical protein
VLIGQLQVFVDLLKVNGGEQTTFFTQVLLMKSESEEQLAMLALE